MSGVVGPRFGGGGLDANTSVRDNEELTWRSSAEEADHRPGPAPNNRNSAGRAIEKSIGRRRRLLMITYSFPPSREIGAQTCAQIARYLPEYGWEAVVLTARERYIAHVDPQYKQAFPGTIIRTGVLPHPLTIYGRLKSSLAPPTREAAPGSKSPGGKSIGKTGGVRRWMRSLLGLPDEITGWILPAVLKGLSVVRRHRVECLCSSGPWWTNHLVGLALSRLTGLPWTAHFRDPWTQVERVNPVSALSLKVEAILERMVVRQSRAVVCVTEQHTRLLRQAYPELPADKFITIPNGYDSAEWDFLSSNRTSADVMKNAKFVITYAGNLYHRRNPLPLFRALRSLIDSGDIIPEHIRVDLIGLCDVAEVEGARVMDMAAECGLAGCVNITGPLGRPETLRRVAESDLLLLLAEGLSYQIPGKTYEYLRAGRPILALTASEGAVADLLRRAGGSWVVDPADGAGVAAAVQEAHRRWRNGVNGPQPDPDLVAGFDRQALASRFAAIFERIAGPALRQRDFATVGEVRRGV